MSGISQHDAWYCGRVVVVTGGFGYLGSGLSARLQTAGAIVRRATRGRPLVESAYVGDLGERSFVDRLVTGADVVFHFAGQTSIQAAQSDPAGDVAANIGSTALLLDACKRGGRHPAFVYAGTATSIGLTTAVPIPPDRADLPVTVYDANKLAAEHLVGVYTSEGALNGVTLRIANVFGPGAAKSAPDRGVTNRLVARALAGQDLTYYGDGSLVRDYVYVEDLLGAFYGAGVLAAEATLRSYVVASGTGHSLRETFELIADVVASLGYRRVGVTSVPWPPTTHLIDQRSFVANIAPLERWMNWRPATTLREGLLRTAEALRRGA